MSHIIHVCIATGQNAANLIPLDQHDAREVWILQTPAMKASAGHLAQALKREGRTVLRLDFADDTPTVITASAMQVALKLDGHHVVLHATGGTKVIVLALREQLRLVEASEGGRLDIVYADTVRQQIDWLGEQPRTEPMLDVLDLQAMLLVQGYRIEGDNRHAEAQKQAEARAKLTRHLGEQAHIYGKVFSTLATLARRAADARDERDRTQFLDYAPGGTLAKLFREIAQHGLLRWDGDEAVVFDDVSAADYLAGGWIEEFVLLKLTGGLGGAPGRFSTNLRVLSADHKVRNEIDAMLVHRNRALLIECKTGRQQAAEDRIYKLAQLRNQLGGTQATALYLSAQNLPDAARKRAQEYRVEVLSGAEVGTLVPWLKAWQAR